MAEAKNYPPIDYHKEFSTPLQRIRELKSMPIMEEYYKDDLIYITAYTKGFFGRKKMMEGVIEKIDDLDKTIMADEPEADDRFLGLTIVSKGEVIYKSLFNLGVMKSSIAALKAASLEQFQLQVQNKLSGLHDDFELNYHRNIMKEMDRLSETTKLLEVLYMGTGASCIL